ncbi:Gp15 family bacteriophage protein [Listeria rocourtiae]|uniref:Gp15 family bacteriophage protein n=1 Tax=Listeria rocourtiae TaxID=647910 RepID=UPI0003E8C253|nr:Gp15 family bacteriophage protein [Listeria rocourtiae]EUJ51794.1 bacteriophage Gp15 family protein [Listeria rocourtiae FSL F6-920]
MFNLAYSLENEVQIGEDTYSINMAYDNILLFIELLGDKSVPADKKLEISIEILLGEQLEYPIETLEKIFSKLLEIVFETEEQEPEEVELDLAGNPLPEQFQKKEKKRKCITTSWKTHSTSFLVSSTITILICLRFKAS